LLVGVGERHFWEDGMDLRDGLGEGYGERYGDCTSGFAAGVIGGPGYD
jgi:hypothetical protein